MPTYEYRCPKCSERYEQMQRISDHTRPKCPACGTRGERVISGGGGLVFKGSGFYVTDYKRGADGKPKEKQQEKASGGPTKSEPTGSGSESSTRSSSSGADS